jgi:hypothetical protein
LFSHEIADRALGGDTSTCPSPLRYQCRRDEALRDETVERSRLVERNQPGDGFAVIGNGHLLATTHHVEVTAEMVSQVSDSSFHLTSMALLCQII